MNIDLWAISSPFLLGPPLRDAGFLQLALTFLGILSLTVRPLLRQKRRRTPLGTSETGLLLALVFIAPLAELLLVIRLPQTATLPGIPLAPASPGFSVLGSLPWLAAAGLLGGPEAALVAFAGGLARGGWITGSLLTPLTLSLQAAVVAALIGHPYRESLARLLRRPLGAALVGGTLYGGLRSAELFVHSGGSIYDGLDFALSLFPVVLLAAVVEGGIAGTVGEAIRIVRPQDWRRPSRLIAGPYNRSLAARMLTTVAVLGTISVVGLAGGQWLLARGAIAELVADDMVRAAEQASASIPFFVQTGRASIREQAGQVAPVLAANGDLAGALRERSASQSFFSRLSLFNARGDLVAAAPEEEAGDQTVPLDLSSALPAALQGVPQEVVLPPPAQGEGARAAFLAPVLSPESGEPIGALAGWTFLANHPLLNPVVSVVTETTAGEIYLVDGQGRVLLHPDPEAVFGAVDVPAASGEGVVVRAAPDGTRRLEYVHPVAGYSWRVVAQTPMRVVDRTAFPIAARLVAVLLAVGGAFLAVVYWSSQRLTHPLRQMARAAQAIAHGDLDRPVEAGGEDEVGQLADSFERMRQALKARLAEMNMLLGVSRSLAAELDLASSLPTVLSGLRRLTEADCARLALAEPGLAGELGAAALQAGGGASWALLDPQISRLCRERGAFALENPARARAVLDLEPLEGPVGALMAAPVRTEEGYAGSLWLGRSEQHPFGEADQNLLAIVSAQLGVWLSNVTLFHRVEEERERLGSLLEVTPDAVIAADPQGHVVLANPAAEVLLTTDRISAVGQAVETVVQPKEVQELLLAGGREERMVEVSLDGGRVLSASAREIWTGGWRTVGRVCVLWDITHFRKLDMLKSEFVSTVSHDLRAPLTLMRGYSTMMSMVGALNEQQKEFLSKILDSIDGMSQLVENLLDLGRIEVGLGLELEAIDLAEIVDEVITTYRPKAVNKKVGVNVDIAEDLGTVIADPTLLRQAIANLLDNGIKFTPGGGKVQVKGRREGDRLLVSVEDTGVGIAPADQSRLFERFYRARRQESLQERGSGLGLAIVRSIAEQHGGQVGVESRLGSGSTFTLDIPAEPEAEPEEGD